MSTQLERPVLPYSFTVNTINILCNTNLPEGRPRDRLLNTELFNTELSILSFPITVNHHSLRTCVG